MGGPTWSRRSPPTPPGSRTSPPPSASTRASRTSSTNCSTRRASPSDATSTGRSSAPSSTWPRSAPIPLDLKLARAAMAEMAEAFRVFRPFREEQKVTFFGSARTLPDDPLYLQARRLAERMAGHGWMVVTGAGPGIMAAGMQGAGRERSLGVNIRLPHEQGANEFIAQDPKLVEMRYFFTRKLMLIKESDGYAVLPGGFGTLDEAFELLTLLQTGKAQPAPLVLLDVPGRHLLAGVAGLPRRRGRLGRVGLARGPRAVRDHLRRGRGRRRAARLLPQLPLVSMGRRPPRDPAARRPHPGAAGRAERALRRHRGERVHPPDQAARPGALGQRPRRRCPGWPCASTASTTGGSASSSTP